MKRIGLSFREEEEVDPTDGDYLSYTERQGKAVLNIKRPSLETTVNEALLICEKPVRGQKANENLNRQIEKMKYELNKRQYKDEKAGKKLKQLGKKPSQTFK